MNIEESTSRGRIDLTVITDNGNVYIIELKVDDKGSALEQIKQRGYAEKYIGSHGSITLIGISFDSSERNISEFIWEKV